MKLDFKIISKKIFVRIFFFFFYFFVKLSCFFPKNWCLTFTKKIQFHENANISVWKRFLISRFFFQKKFYFFFVNFIAKCFCIPNCAWRIQFVFSQYDEKWSVMRNWKLMKNDHPLPLYVFLFLSFSSSLDAHWEVEREDFLFRSSVKSGYSKVSLLRGAC